MFAVEGTSSVSHFAFHVGASGLEVRNQRDSLMYMYARCAFCERAGICICLHPNRVSRRKQEVYRDSRASGLANETRGYEPEACEVANSRVSNLSECRPVAVHRKQLVVYKQPPGVHAVLTAKQHICLMVNRATC